MLDKKFFLWICLNGTVVRKMQKKIADFSIFSKTDGNHMVTLNIQGRIKKRNQIKRNSF